MASIVASQPVNGTSSSASPNAGPPTQYAYRALKSIGIVNGAPSFKEVEGFKKPEGTIRSVVYSADGSRCGFASVAQVEIFDAATATPIVQLPIPGVIEIAFSPKGTWISTWERYVKPAEEGAQHKNMRIWEVATGNEVTGFSQKSTEGWACQFTEDESRALRLVSGEIHVFDPLNFSKGVISKLRLEGMTDYRLSPGQNPHIAAFVAERKGAPASLKVYSLLGLGQGTGAAVSPVGQKTFYKADKIQMKWNKIGTMVLFLTQTDVDKTGKSYYGETNLYMLSANGTFDCRVTLDREGGIHDFCWSPNDKEFIVCYGYMPAKTTIFDHRSNVVHDFGTAPRNFVSYNPQGRLLLIAGFGNLAGQMDIYDRRTLKKVTTVEASNTSLCEWAPDGRWILCATLSPRLRVDNGVRVFHYTGGLVHQELVSDLYAVAWRPARGELYPFRNALSPAPAVRDGLASRPAAAPSKPAGAYRPPHARGTLTPTHFKREDEGGAPYVAPTNGSIPGGAAQQNGNGGPFRPGQRRGVPGAPVPGATPSGGGGGGAPKGGEEGKASRRNKKGGKGGGGAGTPGGGSKAPSPLPSTPSTPAVEKPPPAPAPTAPKSAPKPVPAVVLPAPSSTPTVVTSQLGGPDGSTSQVPLGQLSSQDKKKRSLLKKLTAIEQLKDRLGKGEKLEVTQVKKIDSEGETRRELEALG